MMKAKLKTPEIAKKNGGAFIKKLLKKLLKEPIAEPTGFFYHSAFEFDGGAEPEALMFIGDVPAAWKKAVKQNKWKTSKEFAAGICVFDAATKTLKLEVKMGKGGKNAVLKLINKQLLKPFAKAVLVESVADPVAAEEVPAEDEALGTNDGAAQEDAATGEADAAPDFNIADLVKEAQGILADGGSIKDVISKHVNELGKKLENISDTIVTDDMIEKAKKAVQELKILNIPQFLKDKLDWLKNLPKEVLDNADMKKEIQEINNVEKALKTLKPQQDKLIKNCGLVEKVEAPTESSNPPVSDSPITNFGSALNKYHKQLE